MRVSVRVPTQRPPGQRHFDGGQVGEPLGVVLQTAVVVANTGIGVVVPGCGPGSKRSDRRGRTRRSWAVTGHERVSPDRQASGLVSDPMSPHHHPHRPLNPTDNAAATRRSAGIRDRNRHLPIDQNGGVPRQLTAAEIETLLQRDLVARFATTDRDGYPHVTPIWFVWQDGRFYLTSYSNRPHVRRCIENPRCGLVVDSEECLRSDGERPNRQVRVIADAVVRPDRDRRWTALIRRRYVSNVGSPLDRWPDRDRSVIELHPKKMVAVASV
jgi:Pyridoxamine 5'-phosphate oxidase